MKSLEAIGDLLKHAFWANSLLLESLAAMDPVPAEVKREMAHVIGAEEVWLSRIEVRTPRAAVWPEYEAGRMVTLANQNRTGYADFLDNLDDHDLASQVKYTNSAGKSFTTPLADILMHVALHGQYHRGKINLLLRQERKDPVPTDYIAFVRGVPAATRR